MNSPNLEDAPSNHVHTRSKIDWMACDCGAVVVRIPCPDGRPGCAVAHYKWKDAPLAPNYTPE